jgi:hypothetical protein
VRKKKQVIEFQVKSAAQKESERQQKKRRSSLSEFKILLSRITAGISAEEARITHLMRSVASSRAGRERWIQARKIAEGIDPTGVGTENAIFKLKTLVEIISKETAQVHGKTIRKGSRLAQKKRAQGNRSAKRFNP